MRRRHLWRHAAVRSGRMIRLAGASAPPRWRSGRRALAAPSWRRLARPWPALAAVAAMAVLVIAVARLQPLAPNAGSVGFRGVPPAQELAVGADAVGRAHPDDEEPIVATLSRGTIVTRLEASGEWTRVQLADGRRVWVRTVQLTSVAGGTQNPANNH